MTVPEFVAHMRELEAKACPMVNDVPLFNILIVEANAIGMNYREGLEHVIRRRREIEAKSSRTVQ